jgi:hypothetical protein
MVVRQCATPRLDAELSQSVAALVGQEVLIAVPVDVACADQRLELFWRASRTAKRRSRISPCALAPQNKSNAPYVKPAVVVTFSESCLREMP